MEADLFRAAIVVNEFGLRLNKVGDGPFRPGVDLPILRGRVFPSRGATLS